MNLGNSWTIFNFLEPFDGKENKTNPFTIDYTIKVLVISI